MSTNVNVRRSSSNRFYTPQGEAVYEIPKKKGDGMKKPNINDMIENGWVPSVTTVLRSLHKPNLQDWLIGQAVRAVMDTKRLEGETNDQFVRRVLETERVQDEVSDTAAQLGTDIHDAIANAVAGKTYPAELLLYVAPVLENLRMLGETVWSEKVLIGEGYAGRADHLSKDTGWLTLTDFKSASNPPRKPYPEHKMQLGAYARTIGQTGNLKIRTCVIYISTTNPGVVVPFIEHNWERDYRAFDNLLQVWRYENGVI